MPSTIPFNSPYVGAEEAAAVAKAIAQPILHGDGPISRSVEVYMEQWLQVRHAFLTTSCTHALEMAMIALGIRAGDEVIMPSFTFVSTANAVVLRGGTPVFADIRPDTLTLDVVDVARRITSATKAIVVVHYAGVSADMDEILDLARKHDLYVVEDAAQAVDARYKNRYLGTLGDIGCFSFHDTKNITCGEGGAFLTQRDDVAQMAERIREKGTNRSAFLRGEIDKYSWVSQGSSYIQSDILAALLTTQFEKRDIIRTRRKEVWEAYYDALTPLADAGEIILPTIPPHSSSNYHIFFFRVPSPEQRSRVLDALRVEGIQATFHYVPLHSSPYGRKVLKYEGVLPNTTKCSDTLIRLPIYPQLAAESADVGQRVATILKRNILYPV